MAQEPPSPGGPPRAPQGPARPDYKVYRAGPGLLDRLRAPAPGRGPLDRLRRKQSKRAEPPGVEPRRRPRGWRIVKWIAAAVVAWILISFVVFLVSAATAPGVSDSAKSALASGGSLATGSTVLIIGSDQRPANWHVQQSAKSGPSRSDSILLLHVGVGSVHRLSILRDSSAQIPGHGVGRINSAYALGGAALAIKTIEGFMGNGLRINHVMIVSFTNFPKLIDAMGGIYVTLDNCVQSNSFDGQQVNLSKGEHHLGGRAALEFSRVRENRCNPREDDRARAARQQKVLSAMRSRVVSPLNWPSSLVRLPVISWAAPRALRSDMGGPGLATLFTDLLTGGGGKTDVLGFDSINPDGTLNVSDSAKAKAVRQLQG
ncbi:MAG: LCP family protein [Actinobacteria bacterium]|nr:LCP family protein [Actinomycetota bacterium]